MLSPFPFTMVAKSLSALMKEALKNVFDGFKVGSKAVEVNFLLVAELGLKFRGSQNKI